MTGSPMSADVLINLAFLLQQPTGISTYASEILPALQALNPLLLSPFAIPGFSCRSVPDNMTPDQGSKGHLRRLLWTQFRLPQHYRQLRSQLIFSPLPEAPIYSGCRYVVMAHDVIPLRFLGRFSRLRLYYQTLVPQVLSQAVHIVCNSSATASDLMTFFQVPAAKITPIHLAYNSQVFKPLNLARGNYFLYVGRHDSYKNLQRLIAAFAQVVAEGADVELWLAGPYNPDTPQLQAQVTELGLGQQVKFLNYVAAADLPILLNQAIALVFPTLWEGFGLPVLEAMACGAPVITSNCASLPEVTGDAALLVNPYQVDEIAQAMRQVAWEPDTWQRLHRASLARASQFSWQKTGMATAEVLKSFL